WSQSAGEIERLIRAYHPWPGTFTEFSGKRLKLFPPVTLSETNGAPGAVISGDELEVNCGEGALIFSVVQPEGKPRMDSRDFARGYREQITPGFS
ncbi:methionyl-tRNA formyltransferase, partial [Akkermansiaceae bacterium]|nr:methionyl-tRNA formyltransferase [Akkermansiaceae bacterium]